MATNYLDVYDAAISKAPSTAAARRNRKSASKRLTARRHAAQLNVKRVSVTTSSKQRRTPLRSPREENVVKKRRSKAQRAATKKMIAANRRRSKGKRSKGKRRGRRNPILVTGKNLKTRKVGKRKGGSKKKHAKARKSGGGSSKRSRAAKKAARTRKANKLKRSLAAKKAARSRKRKGGGGHKKKKKSAKARKASAKRSSKKSARKGKRKSAKRSLAAKKAARTRKRNKNKNRTGLTKREKRDYDAGAYAYESRRRGKRRKKNPIGIGRISNPIPLEGGLDFFSGLFAVTIGYIVASAADRMGSTHALTASTAQGGFVDAPAVGQIYDSESPSTPIWSSGMRVAYNALAIAVPMGLSAMIKSKGPKSFFQLMAFAAIARTVGKAADDGLSIALKTTGFGLRLYAPELAAQAKLLTAASTALPNAAPAMFAGAPKQAVAAAPLQQTQIQQNNAPPPIQQSPALAPVNRSVEGAPARTGGLDVGPSYTTGPAFNPWASTDDRR